MISHLKVDTDVAFNTSHVVSNEAEELREELSRLSREWDNGFARMVWCCRVGVYSDLGGMARRRGQDRRNALHLGRHQDRSPDHPVMGMTLRTSAQQSEALRRQAAAEGRWMQAVALSAIDEYIKRRSHNAKVAATLQRVAREEAAVLERLKDA